jgi:hypothetical protein
VASLLLLVAWPVLSTCWPRIWAPRSKPEAHRPDHLTVQSPPVRPYLTAAIVPLAFLISAASPTPDLPMASNDSIIRDADERTHPSLPPLTTVSTQHAPAGPSTQTLGTDTPDFTGRHLLFWTPTGEHSNTTHQAEIILLDGTGTARVTTYVPGAGTVYVDEELTLEHHEDTWWYVGANPVLRGVEGRYDPDFFMLEVRDGQWIISQVCTTLDASECYLAWEDPSSSEDRNATPTDQAPEQLDRATCNELADQAEWFDEIASDSQRHADEAIFDSNQPGLEHDAHDATASANAIRQRMIDGGCT